MDRSKKLFGIENLIFQEIKKLVDDDNHFAIESGAHWTTIVNQVLMHLGEKLNYTVYTSEKHNPLFAEWLYDVIWSMDDTDKFGQTDWRKFRGLELICEVEWSGYDAILHDFTKLTVGNANHRVMIVAHHDEKINEDQWEYTRDMCVRASQYKFQNFNYLLISLPWVSPINLKYFSWTY